MEACSSSARHFITSEWMRMLFEILVSNDGHWQPSGVSAPAKADAEDAEKADKNAKSVAMEVEWGVGDESLFGQRSGGCIPVSVRQTVLRMMRVLLPSVSPRYFCALVKPLAATASDEWQPKQIVRFFFSLISTTLAELRPCVYPEPDGAAAEDGCDESTGDREDRRALCKEAGHLLQSLMITSYHRHHLAFERGEDVDEATHTHTSASVAPPHMHTHTHIHTHACIHMHTHAQTHTPTPTGREPNRAR